MSWLPAEGFVLLLDGFAQMSRNEPEQWDIALKALRDACAFWRPLARPMYALLYGPGEEAAGMLALSAACLSAIDPEE